MLNKPTAPFHSSSFNSPRRLMRPPSTPNLNGSYSSRPRSSSSSSSSQCSSPVRNLSNRTSSPSRMTRASYQGSIAVGVRIKPSNGRQELWHVDNNTIVHEEFGDFSFDHVFSPEMNNKQVYDTIALPMVDSLFEGFNCTIFAYGMTGSGKTYTMSGSDHGPGIIPMCVDTIFERIALGFSGKKFDVKVSYLEIYNERIYDLLNIPQGKTLNSNILVPSSSLSNDLKLRDDPKYGVKVVGLVERQVSSSEQLMKCISIGNHNRKTSETDFNSRSSRSHAVVLIRILCTDELTGEQVMSTFSLCDLAGSERATAQQERRKEGAYINKSLLALGTVISKLSMESTGTSSTVGHIPYRDSKLTRILQPALSGDSLIATICTIDTKPDTSTESMNTIRFASRAKNISLTVKRNEMETSANKNQIIQNLRRQIRDQQIIIEGLSKGKPITGISTENRLRNNEELLRIKSSHHEVMTSLEPSILRDPELIEIVECLPPDIRAMLEGKLMTIDSRIQEVKSYVSQLENFCRPMSHNISTGSTHDLLANNLDVDLTEVLHEQEQELMQLQQALTRKDKMIEALQSAKRLRKQLTDYSIDSGQVNAGQKDVPNTSESNNVLAGSALRPISPNSSELNKQERPTTIGSAVSVSTNGSNPNLKKISSASTSASKYLTASDLLPALGV